MTDAVIVSTARTPLAKSWKGAFNMTHGATLGGHVVRAALERAGIDGAEVEDVLIGCATPEGATGSNVARQVALRAGIQPTYLSKLERGELEPPSETTTRRLAEELGEDEDVLLALAGKVSSDLQEIIRRRPKLFADLIRQLEEAPDHAILRIVREVRDGKW